MELETAMTKALEDAFREAQKLPEREQDQLAAAIARRCGARLGGTARHLG